MIINHLNIILIKKHTVFAATIFFSVHSVGMHIHPIYLEHRHSFWKRQPPFQQAAEQQITVFLDVGFQTGQHPLVILGRGIVHILHVAVIQLEYTETIINIRTCFLLDFLSGAANALLADFADVLVTRLESLALFVAGFGQLHHDKLAVSAVLGVELHHRMGGSGRAGEEVHNNSVLTSC